VRHRLHSLTVHAVEHGIVAVVELHDDVAQPVQLQTPLPWYVDWGPLPCAPALPEEAPPIHAPFVRYTSVAIAVAADIADAYVAHNVAIYNSPMKQT
jgi:hypothetical protein